MLRVDVPVLILVIEYELFTRQNIWILFCVWIGALNHFCEILIDAWILDFPSDGIGSIA